MGRQIPEGVSATSKVVRQTGRKQQQVRQVCSASSASRSMVVNYSSAHSAIFRLRRLPTLYGSLADVQDGRQVPLPQIDGDTGVAQTQFRS
jgi:hypothetical protein